MSSSRETIHISLGSTANAITSHLLNLEGLAATSAEASCDANITHAVEKETYVPRILFVDEHVNCDLTDQEPDRNVTTWTGEIQVQEQEHETNKPTRELLQDASTLAYSTHSRYHVETKSSLYAASASNARHVQWDSDEEEEEEEDEEERARRLQRQELQWQTDTVQPLQEKMDNFWENTTDYVSLSWLDYWMPPYSRNYSVPLPFSRDSLVEQHWDTYIMGTNKKVSENLLEQLRQLLEACDALQGVTIATEGHGIYAGLTTTLLQDLQEECRTAGRFVWNVVDSSSSLADKSSTDKENQQGKDVPWQVAQSERVRSNLQTGLALHDFTTHAHAVLPLNIDSSSSSLFASSAQAALALEASTLPYRLSGTGASRIGLNGGYYGGVGPSDEGYCTAPRLSFGEYLAGLQPSTQYPILELNAHISDMGNEDNESTTALTKALERGTTIERQRLLQQGGRDAYLHRPREVLPGEWLNDANLLTLYSPREGNMDRSLHTHFGLAASMRPQSNTTSTSQYVTLLMEGMAFRYRPEVSMAAVLNESVSSLTSGGYGAGSYWKNIQKPQDPVVSVLGNSSRSYGYLHSVASDMKEVLSPRFKGYLNRDTTHGILPDAQDCEEAVEHCFDLRDVYAPPEGSGLVVNSEGTYFD